MISPCYFGPPVLGDPVYKNESPFVSSLVVMDMHNCFFFCFVRYSREKVFRKKNRDNYKENSKNSGKLQKLEFLYGFSIITDDRNDIFD
jgi:hypothetical protein